MLPECSHTKTESSAQISTSMTKIQNFFYGLFFYWRTLYMVWDVCCPPHVKVVYANEQEA